MKINAKYFGMIAEKIGKTNETFEVNVDAQFNVKQFFENQYEGIKTMNYKIAINQSLNSHINPDLNEVEIALLPPFAGG